MIAKCSTCFVVLSLGFASQLSAQQAVALPQQAAEKVGQNAITNYRVTRGQVNRSFRAGRAHRQVPAHGGGNVGVRTRRSSFHFVPIYRPTLYPRRSYYYGRYYPRSFSPYYYGYPVFGRVIVTRSPILDSRVRTGNSHYFSGDPHASQYFGDPHASQAVNR